MPKKLATIVVVLLAVLGAAIPAAAQEEQGGDTSQPFSAPPEIECEQIADQPTPPVAPETGTPGSQPGAGGGVPGEPVVVDGDVGITPCDQQVNQAAEESATGNFSIQSAPACALCADSALGAAEEAILGGGSGATTPTDAFGAALDAARSSGDIREAAASEDVSGGSVEENAAYLVAFDAAREAGADEETAREAALQAVADLSGETASDEDGDGSAEAATGDAAKMSKEAARDRDGAGRGKTTGEGDEEETGDSEDGGADGGGEEDVATTPAGNGAPLLMGGGVLLVAGLFAVFRVARSRSAPARGRRA